MPAAWGLLLQAGVEIFEYQPTMFHCKVIVVVLDQPTLTNVHFD